MALDALLVEHPGLVRGVLVGALFAGLLIGQRFLPRRKAEAAWLRSIRNVAMTAISAGVVYLLLPVTTVAVAFVAEQKGWGLFNWLDWPLWLEVISSVVVLDLAIYWQHRWFHAIPVLWPIHRVHHSDTEFDVTLGLRFHPAEILLSLAYKMLLIVLLGIAPVAIIIYEVALAAFALLTHSNIAISRRWDGWLRTVFVTPDWHRVHHSIHRDETDSNYGNILSVWDRLFSSYIAQPRDGHADMQIGLVGFRDSSAQTLPALLLQPVRRESRTTSTP
ncbi:MAG: sterol desaturase family protein [Dokdonella sp.]